MSDKIPKVDPPNETTSLTSRRVEGASAATDANEVQSLPEIDLQDLIFDFQMVLDGFTQCKRDDGQLYLDGYLRAYSEINKFFQILGNVFNFVAQDVQKKITILQCYRKGGAGDYYYSIQSMIEYERENNLLTSTDQQSGARTLLRLHRALEFITGFLTELHNAPDESGMGSLTSEVYGRTLAKFHGWVLSKTVGAVLLMMPTKRTIIEKVTLASKQVTGGSEAVRAHNENLMPKVIEVMTSVYNLTQKLYEDYEILDLP